MSFINLAMRNHVLKKFYNFDDEKKQEYEAASKKTDYVLFCSKNLKHLKKIKNISIGLFRLTEYNKRYLLIFLIYLKYKENSLHFGYRFIILLMHYHV